MIAHDLSNTDLILIISGVISLSTIIGLFVRLTWWLSKQFSTQRNLSYRLHEENNRRFVRLEMWANRKGFQPSIDPFDFGNSSMENNGK